MLKLIENIPLDRREGWGMASESIARVVTPTTINEVQQAFLIARQNGWKVHFWGNGRSYGDAALNEGQLLLDFSKMDRILSWDKSTGQIVCEPGVTLEKLWRYILPDGYWPPVVTGTMLTTLGGIVAANAHGKNNWKHGPIGEYVEAFSLVTPDGLVHDVHPINEPELFSAAIGGFGWLGAFVQITLKMKRVHSGRLEVLPFTCESLDGMFRGFERCNEENWDYVVGWIDAFTTGDHLGRGQIHAARYVNPGEDPEALPSLKPDHQDLPERFFGVLPFRWLHWFARPWAHRWGMWAVNNARFFWMNRPSHQGRHFQGHAQFNFLLDYLPNWKQIYQPGGLIQIQLFLPKDKAREVFGRALELCQQARLEPWLVVMKRHRPDQFWLSHALDGYSFALDFPVDDRWREALLSLADILHKMTVESGGKFYFAKDSTLTVEAVQQSLGEEVLRKFFMLKNKLDPEDILQGNLYRRVMAPLASRILSSGQPINPQSAQPVEDEE